MAEATINESYQGNWNLAPIRSASPYKACEECTDRSGRNVVDKYCSASTPLMGFENHGTGQTFLDASDGADDNPPASRTALPALSASPSLICSYKFWFKHWRNTMRLSRVLISALGIALLIDVLNTVSVEAAPPQQGPTMLTLKRVGSSSFASAPMATDISGLPDEIDAAVNGGDADGTDGSAAGVRINRSLPGIKTGNGKPVSSKHKSNPVLGAHFQGLNFHDQRFANGGNQFSVEPPDQ